MFLTLVLARSDELLAHLPGIDEFGWYHEVSRLDDGWQLLLTHKPGRYSDLRRAATQLTRHTGHPVLAVRIEESSCAQVEAAGPDGYELRGHLPQRTAEGCGFLHDPLPPDRPAADVVADLRSWAMLAGRTPGDELEEVCGLRDPFHWFGRPFEHPTHRLAEVLGFGAVRRVPYLFDPYQPALRRWVGIGLGFSARGRVEDAAVSGDILAGWEHPAMALERRLWDSVYRDVDHAELLAEADRIWQWSRES